MRHLSCTAAFLLALVVSVGDCQAAKPRTAEDDARIQSVATVSLVDEASPVTLLGLTAFNNAATTIPQEGALARQVTDLVSARLTIARPQWKLQPAQVQAEALAARVRNEKGLSDARLREALADVARAVEADALFVVTDTSVHNLPGYGVGLVLRSLPGLPARAIVHAHVRISLVDREGREITGRTGAAASMKASELGLTKELSALDQPGVRDRVTEAIRKQLGAVLTDALSDMGY